jgi:hypothetical protein
MLSYLETESVAELYTDIPDSLHVRQPLTLPEPLAAEAVRKAEHASRATGAEGVRVVDSVTARERGGDQGQEFVPRVRPTRCTTEVEVGVDELLQTEMMGERRGQEEPGVSDQAIVIKDRIEAVETVR